MLSFESLFITGQTAVAQAHTVINKLIATLMNSTVGGSQAVFQAISDLAAIVAGTANTKSIENRGLLDYVISLFGLSDVWSAIQGVGSQMVATLFNELVQIMLKGQGAIDTAKPVISAMVQQIKDHSVGKVQAVAQAVADLAAILAGSYQPKALIESRGLVDYALGLFGLGDVWSQVQQLGSGVAAKFLNELLTIILMGK